MSACPHCGHPMRPEPDEEQRLILEALDEDRIPWLWSDQLPDNYRTMVIVGGSCFAGGPEPVILRGSNYATIRRYRTYAEQWQSFVDRAARIFHVTVLLNYEPDKEFLNKIHERAYQKYPRARPDGEPDFYLDGARVSLRSYGDAELAAAIMMGEQILSTLDEVINEQGKRIAGGGKFKRRGGVRTARHDGWRSSQDDGKRAAGRA